MALWDLNDLRATVRFRGDYQNVRKFPDADVDREIQGAFEDFYQIVADTNQGWFDTMAAATTTANVAFVALPTDCWRVQGIDILVGSDYSELNQVGLTDRNRFSSGASQPVAYRLSSRGLELFPTPNTAYTLRVVYTPRAPLLQAAAAREWFNGWDEYVVEAALYQLDKREQRPLNDRITAMQAAEAAVRGGASERRQQEPEYIPLREGDDMLAPFERGIF